MAFTKGQKVRIINSNKYTGFGTVEKQLPKNVLVVLDDGRKVRFDPFFLTTEIAQGGGGLTETPPPYIPTKIPAAGTIVRSIRGDARIAGLHVVLAVSKMNGAQTTMRIAKLGGDNDRYWRWPLNDLVVVTLAEATIILDFTVERKL